MKLNEECIRAVLIYLHNNLDVSVYDDKCCFLQISIQDLVDEFSIDYHTKDIWYSVYNLAACGMIEGIDLSHYDKMRLSEQFIRNLSYRGLQLASNIESDTTWDKVKSVIGRVGSHSLGFIESVAHDLIVETGKQAITILMNQQPHQ